MFSWLKLGLLFLQIADKALDIARAKKLMDAGEEKAVAAASASILQKTGVAKDIMQRIEGMSEAEVDQALKDLEPK